MLVMLDRAFGVNALLLDVAATDLVWGW